MYVTTPRRSEHVHLAKGFRINRVTMNLQHGTGVLPTKKGGSETGSDLLVLSLKPRCSHCVTDHTRLPAGPGQMDSCTAHRGKASSSPGVSVNLSPS